jgi:DNA-binding IscR family transcriptional regulator
MTPKVRKVDKNTVKYDLALGKYPGEIANVWGVSRQYISSIRQELVKEGVLKRGKPGRPKQTASSKDETELDFADIIRVINKTKLLMIEMKTLEEERNQYKKAYNYLLSILGNHLSEQEMNYVETISRPQPSLMVKEMIKDQLEQNEILRTIFEKEK